MRHTAGLLVLIIVALILTLVLLGVMYALGNFGIYGYLLSLVVLILVYAIFKRL